MDEWYCSVHGPFENETGKRCPLCNEPMRRRYGMCAIWVSPEFHRKVKATASSNKMPIGKYVESMMERGL